MCEGTDINKYYGFNPACVCSIGNATIYPHCKLYATVYVNVSKSLLMIYLICVGAKSTTKTVATHNNLLVTDGVSSHVSE